MKWIMVNIMNSQEFVCQILNRDLWSDRQVQRVIRENFFFLQVLPYLTLVDESTPMMNLKAFDTNACILSINTRILVLLIPERVWESNIYVLIAGEQVKTWSNVVQPTEFIIEIHEFLDRFSLNEQVRNPIGRKNKIKKVYHLQFQSNHRMWI